MLHGVPWSYKAKSLAYKLVLQYNMTATLRRLYSEEELQSAKTIELEIRQVNDGRKWATGRTQRSRNTDNPQVTYLLHR